MAEEIRDNPTQHRFELDIEGTTAFVTYRLSPSAIEFLHTEVPKALAGRGIGSRLAQGVLEIARQRGLKVTATCPFIAGYMAKHPEFQGLAQAPGS